MKSLKMKLILFVLAISFVITAVISTVAMTFVSSTANTTLLQTIRPLGEQMAKTVTSDLSFYTKAVDTAVSNTIIRNSKSTSAQVSTQMASEAQSMRSSAYILYDTSDKPYISLLTGFSEDYTQMDFYKKAKSERVITVTGPLQNNSGKSYFCIAAPVSDVATDKDLYVLLTFYTYDKISDIVSSVSFGKSGRGYLINRNGLTVSDSIEENVANGFNALEAAKTDRKYKELASVYEQSFSEASGAKSIRMNGEKQIVAFSEIENTDWILILVAPEKEFLTNTGRTILVFVALALGIFIIVSIVTFFLVRTIVLPIVKTTDRLKALSEGNLTDPVEVTRQKNEIGVLSSSLEETVYSLKQYIDKISEALTNIADGNLAFEMTGNFRGDFVKIKTTFNSILCSLRETFGNITNASEQVNSGTAQLSQGAQALSQGAAQQATSIELLSGQLSGISTQVKFNAEAASKTDSLVDQITDEIGSCNEKMSQMLSSMDDINKSSTEISKIIKVIDDIAFQTNILALNAAVEAARAGSAGRGFAVVADEVRNLAAKSAEAAKQTTSLIESSVNNVKTGTKIAKTTAASLDTIVGGASDISRQVKKIANASQEQAHSVAQINISVDEISSVVQTNTATAEQSAAASEELSSQSNLLRDMIAKFKISGDFNCEEDGFDSTSVDFSASSAPAFNVSEPVNDNKSFDFGAPAQEKTFDFGEPLSDNKPFDFGAPAQDSSFDFDPPAQDKPFDFGEPISDNKPFDFDAPSGEADASFDFEVPQKQFDFKAPEEEKPFDFDRPSQINLEDDFENDKGKY